MRTIARVAFVFLLGSAFAWSDDAVDWDRKYKSLLKERPDIRKKVETGGATKEDVIAWMKKGGDKMKKKAKSLLWVEARGP